MTVSIFVCGDTAACEQQFFAIYCRTVESKAAVILRVFVFATEKFVLVLYCIYVLVLILFIFVLVLFF